MHYRVYYLDLDDGHIIDVHEFRAKGDLAAIVKAGSALVGESRELWNQGRKVVEFVG